MLDLVVTMLIGVAIGYSITRLIFWAMRRRTHAYELPRFHPGSHQFHDYAFWSTPGKWTKKQRAASDRGWELLQAHLTPEQRHSLDEHGYFDVIGGSSKRTYRIMKGFTGNVMLLSPTGKITRSICFGLRPGTTSHVMGDHLLAQKICLEVDEENTLKVAH